MQVTGLAIIAGVSCAVYRATGPVETVPVGTCADRTIPPGVTTSTHLLGWGSGVDGISADDAARAEIAKAFGVTVTQQFESNQRLRLESRAGKSSIATSTFQQDKTRTTTNAHLSGVQISRHWIDRNEHCALAVLDKNQVAESLLSQVRDLEKSIEHHMDAGKKLEDPLAEIQNQNSALHLAVERDELTSKLTILERRHVPKEAVNTGSIRRARRSTIQNTGVQIKAHGLPSSVIRELESQLHRHGFSVSPQGKILVEGVISTKLNGPDDFGFHHGEARLTINFSTKTGASKSQFQLDARASSQGRHRAQEKSIEQLGSAFKNGDGAFDRHVTELIERRLVE